jgi:hypothetical protein
VRNVFDHDHRGDERHHEADRDDPGVIHRHLAAALVEVVDEGADHGRDREEEGNSAAARFVGSEQHRADDGGAGATRRESSPCIARSRSRYIGSGKWWRHVRGSNSS